MNNRLIDSAQIIPAIQSGLLIAALALAPFFGGDGRLVGTAVLSIIVIISGGLTAFRHEQPRPVAFIWLSVFLLFAAASLFVTASRYATVEAILYFTACVVAALTASIAFADVKRFSIAVIAMAAVGLVLGALGVREHYLAGGHWRVFATFLSPGFFGGYLALAFPLAAAAFLSTKSPAATTGSGLAIGFISAALLLTGTRFAVASAALALVTFVVFAIWTKTIKRSQAFRLLLALVIITAGAIPTFSTTTSRVAGAEAVEQAHSGSFRVATWKGTLNIISAHLLLGTGVGSFELVFPKYRVAGYTRMAHNGYLQIASEAGVPALLAFFIGAGSMLIAGFRGLKRRNVTSPAFLLPNGSTLLACAVIAAIIGSLVRNLLDSDIYNPAIGFSFWMLLGLAASRAQSGTHFKLSRTLRTIAVGLAILMLVIWCSFIAGDGLQAAGDAAKADGSLLSAEDYYRRAAAIDPLRADHWLQLGVIRAFSSSDYIDGVEDIKRAIRLEPTRARNMMVLGRVYALHGATQQAEKVYRDALGVDPYNTRAMLALAELTSGTAESERLYRRLIDQENSPVERLKGVPELINPDYARAYVHFGDESLRSGDRQAAKRYFESAIDRLNQRKSHEIFNKAAAEAGLTTPEEEESIAALLESAKEGLKQAEGGR